MKYYYVIHTPDEKIVFDADIFASNYEVFHFNEYTLAASARSVQGCRLIEISVSSVSEKNVYLSVCAEYSTHCYKQHGNW